MTLLSDPHIEDHLNDALNALDFESLDTIVDSHNHSDSNYIFDIVAWILRQFNESADKISPRFDKFAAFHIQNLSQHLTAKELLLIIQGELCESKSLHLLAFSIHFIKNCAVSIGLSSKANMSSLFSTLKSQIHQFLSISSFSVNDDYITLLGEIGDMLKTLFSQEVDSSCFEGYVDDILYYFEEPLQFIDCNEESLPIFSSFLSVLTKVFPSVYKSFYKYYNLVYKVPNLGSHMSHFDEKFRALLYVWNLCMSNGVFHSCIPEVYTKYYKYQMFVYLSIPFVINFVNALKESRHVTQIDIKQLIRVQECIMNNSPNVKDHFPSIWWRKPVVSLIENFETISKSSIMSAEIPAEIKNSVFTIEALLSTATITARCELYKTAIECSGKSLHSGLRSHMIVNFKNFLHSELTSWKENKLPKELKAGETRVILPYYPDFLRRICDSIFIYPLPDCSDSLTDQLSWLTAALNFAFYLIARYNHVKSGDSDEDLKNIMEEVAQATFKRVDESGGRVLKHRFIDPLDKDIATNEALYRRALAEYNDNLDPSSISPNAPSEKECERTLFDLQFLITSITSVKDLLT